MAKSVKGVKQAVVKQAVKRAKSVRHSAGLLMYRKRAGGVEVFLAHPGGPIWAKRDKGAWTIPKGRHEGAEALLDAAMREFNEETGFVAKGPFVELGSVTQKSGKVVTGWAFKGNCDPAKLTSNTCELEWPPRSGKIIEIPEVDRGAWFGLAAARESIRPEQVPLVDALEALLLRGI
jgi:predicted NUDIX family NTP pyrophosphohydrolase